MALLLAVIVVGGIVALVLALRQPWRDAPVSQPTPSVSTTAATPGAATPAESTPAADATDTPAINLKTA